MRKKPLPVLGQSPEPERDMASGIEHEGFEKTVVRVGGMDCASCAATVERGVARVPGVERATVNFASGRLDAVHTPDVSIRIIEKAVKDAGYSVESGSERERTSFWKTPRAFSVIVSTLLFGAGLVVGVSGGSDAARIALYAAAIIVGGVPIFRTALAGVRAFHLDMNVLMSLAVIGGAAIGEWAEAASVVVLFATGNALQVYAVDRTRGAVRSLARLAPETVLIRRGGSEREVAVEDVRPGETVVVRPGERFALDGEVSDGATTVDEASITGESVPVEKAVGDEIYSGTLNGTGGLLVKVTKSARNSTLQRITTLVEEAQGTKAPAERLVDRFSRIYTPAVVGVAAVLAFVPPLAGADFQTWFYRALALLIIACPCALVISTPVTVVSGIGAASRLGVLIKGGEALEAAGRLKALALDKTGTLTEGRPVVSRVIPSRDIEESEALVIAAALERRSEHPLAFAILSAARERLGDREFPDVSGFDSITGRGAGGKVEGERYLIGSAKLFEERGESLDSVRDALHEVTAAGETPVILGGESGPLAVFGLADAVREDSREAIESLKASGIAEVVMLTGDAEAPAYRIASQLGISYRANLSPQQKVEAVRELADLYGLVGMVGDGINDAPALAVAPVGFAMGAAGSDVALDSADVALMKDDLPRLAQSIELSRSAERIIRQNIAISLAVKGVFVILAPFGLVALWLAVLADMGTSLAVTLNGLRLFGK